MDINCKDRGQFKATVHYAGRKVNDGKSVSESPIDSDRGVLYHDNCGTGLVNTNH